MLTAEALFVVCANCGEWAWNGTYRCGIVIVSKDFISEPGAFCFCCIREKMNQDDTWFDTLWGEDSSNLKIDKNLICRN